MNATHQHNFLPEVDGNGLKTGVVSCDCGAWEQGGEDEGVYVEGNRITDAGAWQCAVSEAKAATEEWKAAVGQLDALADALVRLRRAGITGSMGPDYLAAIVQAEAALKLAGRLPCGGMAEDADRP